MADNLQRSLGAKYEYYPYVELQRGEGKGLVETLSAEAAVVVTDDFPCFFMPRMLAASSLVIRTRFEAVDSNGLASHP